MLCHFSKKGKGILNIIVAWNLPESQGAEWRDFSNLTLDPPNYNNRSYNIYIFNLPTGTAASIGTHTIGTEQVHFSLRERFPYGRLFHMAPSIRRTAPPLIPPSPYDIDRPWNNNNEDGGIRLPSAAGRGAVFSFLRILLLLISSQAQISVNWLSFFLYSTSALENLRTIRIASCPQYALDR